MCTAVPNILWVEDGRQLHIYMFGVQPNTRHQIIANGILKNVLHEVEFLGGVSFGYHYGVGALTCCVLGISVLLLYSKWLWTHGIHERHAEHLFHRVGKGYWTIVQGLKGCVDMIAQKFELYISFAFVGYQ